MNTATLGRRAGSATAARAHCSTIGTRMTTYPSTSTRLSRCSPAASDSNIGGTPSARISTPTICTIVVSRNSQSSVS